MRANSRQIAIQNIGMLHHGHRLVDSLENAGIQALALKGFAFLDWLYPDPSTRSMVDIDILVPRAQKNEALRIADKLGYENQYPKNRTSSRDFHYNSPLRHPKTQVTIEIHFEFAQAERYCVDYLKIFESAQNIELRTRRFRTLSSEDHLLHLAIHHAKHSFVSSPKNLEDGLRLLKLRPIRWDVLIDNAERYACKMAVFDYLGRLRRLGAPILYQTLDTLKPPFYRKRCLQRMRSRPPRGSVEYILKQWLAVDSSRQFMYASAAFARRRLEDIFFESA